MTKINVPVNAAEIAEYLSDDIKVAQLVKNQQLTEFIDAYQSASKKNDPSIAAQIKEGVQAGLVDFERRSGEKTENNSQFKPGSKTDASLYNKVAVGSKVESEFDGMADFFQTIWHNNNDRSAEHLNKLDRVRNAFGSTDGASGGFLIPETLRSEILSLSLPDSVVRPRATVIPMSGGRVLVPSVDSTSNASSVFGGMVAYWTEEAGTMALSNATFGRVALDANELTVYTEAPDQLLADGVAFEAFLSKALPATVSDYEDRAFLQGNGVGQPQGVLNAPAGVVVTKETGQAAATIKWENIVKMYSRMLPESLASAVWLVPSASFSQLATMALNVGTGGSAIWLNNGVVGPPMTILGRPVVITNKVPSLGSEGDISFVDLRYYLIGDRQAMTATSSAHFKFQTNQTAFKVVSRVDGRAWLTSAITPENGDATLSPFVKLGARA